MALKYQLETIEDLDEPLQQLYTEKNGKYVLDVEGVEPVENIKGLKSALAKEREAANAYKKFGDPDDIAQQIADLEQKIKEAGKGSKAADDAQAKIDQLTEQYEAKLKDSESRFSQLLRRQATADLKAELAKAGVVPEGLDLLAGYATNRLQFENDGSVKVLTADGKPMIGSGDDHGATLSDLARELAESIPHLVADKGAGGGGTPSSKGGKPNPTSKPLKEWTDAEKGKFIRENGLEAWTEKVRQGS